MNLERHATAAADAILDNYHDPHFHGVHLQFPSLQEPILVHMKAAVDEATALYRADPNIVVTQAYSFDNGMVAAFDPSGNQIPEIQRYTLVELMNLLLQQKARLLELEKLVPLIEAYGSKCGEAEANRGYRESIYEEADTVLESIKAILKVTVGDR